MSKIKIFLPLIILIFAVGCGSVKQADSVASEFYDFIKEEKFVEACGLVDTQALAYTPLERWIDGLEEKQRGMGSLLSYRRVDYYTVTEQNVTRVEMKYLVRYVNGALAESLEFILRDGKYFITYYEFNPEQENAK